jgi:hypothetical protein
MRRSQILLAAVAFALALALAACGGAGGGSPAVAHIGTAQPTATASAAAGQGIAHSECMRSHGVPGFPDPTAQGYVELSGSDQINPDSPGFLRAQQICAKLDPVGGQSTQTYFDQNMVALLKYAACMRAHGITNFPDPVPYGDGGVELLVPNHQDGIDQDAPQYVRAAGTCQPLMPDNGS